MKKGEEIKVLFMGTYPPRECGIATFTKDLSIAINKKLSSVVDYRILALNNNGVNIYNYPKRVITEISDTYMDDYINAAKKINESEDIVLVCIQHEFGIFGGNYGDYLLAFLEILEKPVVITFHSILPEPNEQLRKVAKAISEKVDEIVVMTKKGVEILRKDYDIDTKINVIPHGIPSVPFENQDAEKENLGLKDKIVLSSFGMINQGKGYEYIIESLPEIVEKFPNLVYIIVGETHPNIRKIEGEKYRNFLCDKVKKLGLEKNVKFYNKYVKLSEIIQYLKATDIYISSGLDPNQITSGTLSYALGCGRATISTSFLHAKDLVDEQKGILVDFRKPKQFKEAILKMLENEDLRKEMEKNSYYQTRNSTWANVAIAYSKIFNRYLNIPDPQIDKLPKIDMNHLVKMTDNFGIIQFAKQSNPDRESGYTLDDNARAMLVCTMHYKKYREYKQLKLLKTYLDYMKYVQSKEGKLYNLVDKNKGIDKDKISEDAHGRALWALGYLISSEYIPEDFKKSAEKIFLDALTGFSDIKSPRATSFIINGLYYYNKSKNTDEIKRNIENFADHLVSLYKDNTKKGWRWFEPYLTYSNSKLPESLIYAYLATNERKYLKVALSSLNFLISKTFERGTFIPIGQNGWYPEDGKRSYYDQQPVDTAYMVQTLVLAYKVTKNPTYKKLALNAFQWFLGKNSLNQVIYNEETGGCHDGLGRDSINLNQGAESTLSYLIARFSLTDFQ